MENKLFQIETADGLIGLVWALDKENAKAIYLDNEDRIDEEYFEQECSIEECDLPIYNSSKLFFINGQYMTTAPPKGEIPNA